MSATNGLPIEIVESILENCYFDRSDGYMLPNYATLTSLSLVCHTWSILAQKLVFHDVRLNADETHRHMHKDSFQDAITPRAAPENALGLQVRALTVTVGRDPAVTPADLAQYLTHCPKLYQLTLTVEGMHDLSSEQMHCLRKISNGANIRALVLSSSVQSPILYQLLALWPTIRFLTICTEMAAAHPTTPVACELYELVLRRTPPADIMSWLLEKSEDSLRILELRDLVASSEAEVLAKHAPKIRSLRLMRYDSTASHLLGMCYNLEELIVLHLPVFYTITTLPLSLQHISFINTSVGATKAVSAITTTIASAPNLRLLTCDHSTTSSFEFPALKAVCKANGIEIRMETRRFWTNDDPVEVVSFPRRRSVSNFRLMN